MSRALSGLALGAVLAAGNAAASEALPLGDWNFRALLDGEPIGQHRFSVTGQGETRSVVSDARFTIKFIGITAYRYAHQATEQWRGPCLAALNATTDDDGKPSRVQAAQDGDAFVVRTGAGNTAGTASTPGCVMSFAYWNPAIQTQTRLLNAQTGKLESVQVRRVGPGSIEVRGQPVAATEYRITGPAQPISVWYSPQGEWLGLDSTVAGGRRLSYRLAP